MEDKNLIYNLPNFSCGWLDRFRFQQQPASRIRWMVPTACRLPGSCTAQCRQTRGGRESAWNLWWSIELEVGLGCMHHQVRPRRPTHFWHGGMLPLVLLLGRRTISFSSTSSSRRRVVHPLLHRPGILRSGHDALQFYCRRRRFGRRSDPNRRYAPFSVPITQPLVSWALFRTCLVWEKIWISLL